MATTTNSHSDSAAQGFADLAGRVRRHGVQGLELGELRSTGPHALLVACGDGRGLARVEEGGEGGRDAGGTAGGGGGRCDGGVV